MEEFAVATHRQINDYRYRPLCKRLCGNKPFGSRHWEYPWAIEQSGILQRRNLRILDVAPDFTFPYATFIANRHQVTFIDLEQRKWSGTVTWGADVSSLPDQHDYRIMDVRDMSFDDGEFDVIFCVSVLEHIVCPTQNPDHPHLKDICSPQGARPALKEMFRCLTQGGRLVLTIDIYGGYKWKTAFSDWDILADLKSAGFRQDIAPIDREAIFNSSDSYISNFHGPYVTLGFCLQK